MRDDEPRPVWMSPLITQGPVRNPVLQHRVRLFSLVPLVWESTPKLEPIVCVYYCRTYYKAVRGGGGGG